MKNQPQSLTSCTEQLSRLQKLVPLCSEPLKAVFIYEDSETREWAREAYAHLSKRAARQAVSATWWKLDNLSQPSVLAAAVSTAMRADVVVLALRGGEGLPLSFYAWMHNWLPNRMQAGGVLVTLLGKGEHRNGNSGRVAVYLREVARQGRLHFLLEKRKLAAAAVNGNQQPRVNGSRRSAGVFAANCS
ncbi:MAG TPA: hypothetical protein VLT36_23755 [Candidatus Dormibacteraeota bacterium]|nr:hypothetical protein [Candidatus Dormibacteraeota bacterium]